MCWRRGIILNDGQARRQSRHIAAEGAGDLYERDEGQVVLSPFDAADVAAVEARLMRQPLLRHIEFAARRAYPLPKNVQIRIHRPKSEKNGLLVHGV